MGFYKSRIIDIGGSAVVYKGYVLSAETVAVKRFDQFNEKAFTRNLFSTKFAIMTRWLNHCNLVQLQGWYCEESELVLVYEYLSNGSLYQHIHKTSVSSITTLSWILRLKEVLGVASALSSLHEECERQIIHRDVKTCNIMLDDEFNAKLGDFGLAEVYGHCCVSRDATIPARTIGYLAPEYVYTSASTVKTDVYSFGVVVLEVATGKRPVKCFRDGKIVCENTLDARLDVAFNKKLPEIRKWLFFHLSPWVSKYMNSPCDTHLREVKHIMRSTSEAEYRSLANYVSELVWIEQLLGEVGISVTGKPVVWCDNTSTISMATNPTHHARIKHVEIDIHFVRERVLAEQLSVNFVPSAEQVADILTKPLPPAVFGDMCSRLGIKSWEEVNGTSYVKQI
ncbi:L-type lectin-domain containing receptor kinase S.6-like [Hibiscus syriacus]|uniref:L-type lectin-domain containing receptor kinase S.6-like n=1 Tax=Hibiscus syriacus TaxID=106335 RepID=UPI00192459C9|nr:L-type lectin-domain containing receptor kinase S.6-like [Hibiscus syriacus]